jgi:hypothetical protein
MTFQKTLQFLSPRARARLQTILEVVQQRLSPTDWERLQTFIGRMPLEWRAAMMAFVLQRETHAPAVGTEAPDFTLPRLSSDKSDEWVQLASFRHFKPVALIFGSFT